MSEYDSDILTWSEHQSTLLRRLAADETVNDQVDWKNVAEEIESVGREQLLAVGSLLPRALIHQLKAQGWPESRDAPVWLADSINFRAQAANRFAPSMRQRIDIERIYRQACRAIPASIDGQAPVPPPDTCPFSLDALLSED
jgi:hypothetical protein